MNVECLWCEQEVNINQAYYDTKQQEYFCCREHRNEFLESVGMEVEDGTN